jgi:hypothetical protein
MGPCAYVLLLALFLSIWQLRVTGRLSVTALAVFAMLGVLSLVYGRVVTRLAFQATYDARNLTVQFLAGYLLLNTLLALLSLVFPFAVATSALVLAGGGVLGFFRPETSERPSGVLNHLPSLICLLVSGAAATLWCADSMRPMVLEGQHAIFRTWQDTFIHVRHISAISQSHGLSTLSDIQLSDVPPRIYHYGGYFAPRSRLSPPSAPSTPTPASCFRSASCSPGSPRSLWRP